PGNGPEHCSDGAALIEDVAAEAGEVLQTEGKVELQVFLEAMLLRIGEHAVSERFCVRSRQRGHVQRPQTSVDADARCAIGRDVQVAAAHFDHLFQQFAKRNSSHLAHLLLTEPFRAEPLPSWSYPIRL